MLWFLGYVCVFRILRFEFVTFSVKEVKHWWCFCLVIIREDVGNVQKLQEETIASGVKEANERPQDQN